MAPIANARESNISSPVGRRTFAGVPFDMGSGQFSGFVSQHEGHPEYPTEATLALSGSAHFVHVLFTGVYVVSVAASRTVGDITLSFADGSVLTVPIVSWSTFREGWRYTDEPARGMTAPAPPVTWDNVLEQSQTRAGRPAVGLIDRITIQIPENLTRAALVSLRFRDTSSAAVQLVSPGVNVHAVTLESR
jgi:hypothetical protein